MYATARQAHSIYRTLGLKAAIGYCRKHVNSPEVACLWIFGTTRGMK